MKYKPGYILQRIEEEFLDARLKGYSIDRVMVDDVAYWEMNCPFVGNDETFGDTLVEFLRRHGVTSLLICGDLSQGGKSIVQQPIIDSADCLIQLDRVEFRDMHHVLIRVMKTRGMKHRRESFELSLGLMGLEVKPTLLRIEQGGEVKPVKIRLFLHRGVEMQERYNVTLLKTLQAILSQETDTEYQYRIYLDRGSPLSPFSAIDELQVWQLDEFQLPDLSEGGSRDLTLHIFSNTQWNDEDWDFVPHLTRRVRNADGFFAVPAYENISLIAYYQDRLEEVSGQDLLNEDGTIFSWECLAEACKEWELKHSHDPTSDHPLFFDFPATQENYNCLFFEILLSLEKTEIGAETPQCQLRDWLNRDIAIKASEIYRQLCRRAYFSDDHKTSLGEGLSRTTREPQRVESTTRANPRAVVWRHWYGTLNEMMSKLEPAQREKIQVVPLPGGRAMAGEWYLGIPAYSAAPDIGLEIIKSLTTYDAELDRLRLGIGLPTRSTFYDTTMSGDLVDTSISPYFSMNAQDLQNLVHNAFRRSDLGCYSKISLSLSHHLQRIIEIPDGSEEEIQDKIRNIFRSLETRMEFLRADRDCSQCPIRRYAKHDEAS